MRLGGLIDTLEHARPDMEVRYSDGYPSNCLYPGWLCSWRGSYDQLTLVPEGAKPTHHKGTWPPTAKWLLGHCRDALEREFDGYKGGKFAMTLDTPVWADEWGESSGFAIAGAYVAQDIRYGTSVLVLSRVPIGEYVG